MNWGSGTPPPPTEAQAQKINEAHVVLFQQMLTVPEIRNVVETFERRLNGAKNPGSRRADPTDIGAVLAWHLMNHSGDNVLGDTFHYNVPFALQAAARNCASAFYKDESQTVFRDVALELYEATATHAKRHNERRRHAGPQAAQGLAP